MNNYYVEKRDNTIEPYNNCKFLRAIEHACKNTNTVINNISELLEHIEKDIVTFQDTINSHIINIEDIQNIVENKLMDFKLFETAKHYIEYRRNRNKSRKTESYVNKITNDITTPWGMLGYITYKRTYARRLSDDNETTEEFRQTILRVLDACQKQLKINFTNEELRNAYKYFMSLKCSVAGRFLWQLGTKTVDKLGIMSLQNCAFVNIDEPIRPFTWIFDVLMLGTGVGFNIQVENISKLPCVIDKNVSVTRLDTKDADFIIPDSREGWVFLLEKVLEAFFIKGKSFTYSTILIRGAGQKINGFGGTASGPEDLVHGINNITNILSSRKGMKLTSVNCLDIVNIIASMVVAGNVRRCLPAGSLVHCRRGLVKIEQVEIGDEVLTSDGSYYLVKNKFDQGVQKLIKINTTTGEFLCTPNHRMAVLIPDKKYGISPIATYNYGQEMTYIWKQAKELVEEDILVTTRIPITGTAITRLPKSYSLSTEYLNEDIAWLFGIFQAGGFINATSNKYDNWSISFEVSENELRLATRIKSILYILDNDAKVTIKRTASDSLSIVCKDKNLVDYFNKYIGNNTNENQYIPDFIMKANIDNRLAFIAGVVDNNPYDSLYINTSTSMNWSKQLQTLCYSCGFETKLTSQKVTLLLSKQQYNIYNLSVDTVYSKSVLNSIRVLHKKIESERYRLDVHVKWYPTKVKKIEMTELQEETYDIEVENIHQFYCNGYLTHNSALIAIGDVDDKEYLMAKRWDLGIPNWRAMSNNSVICNDITELPKEFWDGYTGIGEPYGLINIDLSRKIGRTKDGNKYPDPDVKGYNPCCEQGLCNYETCCLAEIFLPNVKNYEELVNLTVILYRICKHSLLLNCHHHETEDIVHKNMRMGIGVTGYMQCSQEQKNWLSPLYEYLREYDIEYSQKINCNTSIKLTTCKPSGTLSILPGVTPGVHPGIYKYFIRRIRIASDHNLVTICKKNGYHVEYQLNFDGTEDKNTIVVEFPCKYPDGTKLANEMTAINQLETIVELQHNWSDNAVSCTIYYKLEELEDIKEWLMKNYKDKIKSCSFLLHNEHGFKQAPYEEITEDKYNELIKKVIPIHSGNITTDDLDNYECPGGVCPIK